MAHHLIRVGGIIFTLTLLLAILLGPAQAGEVVTASIGSNEQSDESVVNCLVIITGTVLLAVWIWAEEMWRFIPSYDYLAPTRYTKATGRLYPAGEHHRSLGKDVPWKSCLQSRGLIPPLRPTQIEGSPKPAISRGARRVIELTSSHTPLGREK
jgi:hypothetical protein